MLPGILSNKRWMITFADMLTLLLCFIVSGLNTSAQRVPKSGIALATTKLSATPEMFALEQADFQGEMQEMTESSRNRLKTFISQSSKEFKKVFVEVCAETEKPAWHYVMTRSLTLKSQLFDLIPDKEIEIKLLGNDCQSLRTGVEQSKAVEVRLHFEN